MNDKERHRQMFPIYATMSIFVFGIIAAVITAFALENRDLGRKLNDCRSAIEAQACECQAYYNPQPEGQSVPVAVEINAMAAEAHLIFNFFQGTEYAPVADIILAMSILETGWYKSSFHKERNNFFSTKKLPNGKDCMQGGERECFTNHKNLMSSCKYALKGVFRKKGYRTDREGFLEDIVRYQYAEDPDYIKKIKKVVKKIRA